MTDYAKWDRMVVDSDSSDEEQASASQSADAAPPPQPPASALKDAESLMEHMVQIEELGEEIVDERAQMVDLDRKRQGNREALRVLRKAEQASADGDAAGSKYWVCFGDTFYRRSHEQTRKTLEEEQRTIEAEIERLRGSVKRKSSRLCELDPSITGGSEVHKSFVSLHGVTSEQLALQFGDEVGAL